MALNKVIIMGRLTRDPDVRYTAGPEQRTIARYTLAADRRGKDQGADFINCVAFDKLAAVAEKYLRKGRKITVVGHIHSSDYTNDEGKKVYTSNVIVEEQYFSDTNPTDKQNAGPSDHGAAQKPQADDDGFMAIPDDVSDEGLPFN